MNNTPAFPTTATLEDHYGNDFTKQIPGMTLLDYIAIRAMQSMINNEVNQELYQMDVVARRSYLWAKAMMAAKGNL